jgi:type IV secretory pathway TrbL component
MNNLEDILDSIHDSNPKTEDIDIDSDNLKVQIKLKKLESDRYDSDTKDRKWLAIWTAALVSVWLILVILVLVFNEKWLICLSENVLITLLGTTTLNVLGLSFIVLRGHFNTSK